MSTATSVICAQALKRLRIVQPGESAQAEDAADTLVALNNMMLAWAYQGLNLQHQEKAAADAFDFWVPPSSLDGSTIAIAAYQGAWNASTNSPTLTSGSGTEGDLYRVSVAGSTALDDETFWSAGDWLVFDGTDWLKCTSSRRFHQAVVDLLAVQMSSDYGKEPGAVVVTSARDGWIALQAEFIRVDDALIDAALRHVPSRRYYGVLESDT